VEDVISTDESDPPRELNDLDIWRERVDQEIDIRIPRRVRRSVEVPDGLDHDERPQLRR